MASNIRSTTNERLDNVVRSVAKALQIASNYGLEVETIATAMIYLKENPDKTIEDALNAGLSDWDI